MRPARFLLACLTFTAVAADLAVAANVVDVAICEDDLGWLPQGIVRDVDIPKRELILDFGPTSVGAGIQQNVAVAIEKAIEDALKFYRTGLTPAGVSGTRPWEQGVPPPRRLLCATDPADGLDKYILFPHTFGTDTLGEYRARPPVVGRVPDIRIDPSVVVAYRQLASGIGKADSVEIVVPAHELFHAIQAAHPMFTAPMISGGGCDEYKVCTASWVDEGIADAMAHAWLWQYENGALNSITSIQYDRQLPHLDVPLHKIPNGSLEAYAGSLFWEYLAWEPRYVRNDRDHQMASGTLMGLRPNQNKTKFDPRLILRFMNMDSAGIAKYSVNANRKGAWELEWLDKVLRDALVEARDKLSIITPRSPKGGLFVVYPKYAAWLVAHQTNMRSGQIDKRLRELFSGGCLYVTLTSDFEAELPLEIPDISTVCVVLERQKVTDVVDIKLNAPRPDRERIHLGWNGEVIPPHSKGNRTARRWTVGLPLGSGSPSPTGLALVLAFSNVPEDTSAISAQKSERDAAVTRGHLTFTVR